MYKVFHGHFSDLHWLQSKFSIVVNPPIIDTAVIAQGLDNMWEDGQPSLQTLCRQYLDYELDKTHTRLPTGARGRCPRRCSSARPSTLKCCSRSRLRSRMR